MRSGAPGSDDCREFGVTNVTDSFYQRDPARYNFKIGFRLCRSTEPCYLRAASRNWRPELRCAWRFDPLVATKSSEATTSSRTV